MPADFDPQRILMVLVAHHVDFVLIGGLAAIASGSPFPTEDVDITPALEESNLVRLSTALTALGAGIRTEGVEGGLPFGHDAESLAAAGMWNLSTPHGDLDIAMRPAGTDGYRDLAAGAVSSSAYGVTVKIAALADVIRSKQAANRPKDQRVLPTLREILATRNDRASDT